MILKNLDNGFLNNDGIRLLISNAIGSSKLAFLDSSGHINIINEHLGHWSDDNNIWYSNDGYKSCNYVKVNIGNFGQAYTSYNRANYNRKLNKNSGITDRMTKSKSMGIRCDYCWTTQKTTKSNTLGHICDSCHETYYPQNITL